MRRDIDDKKNWIEECLKNGVPQAEICAVLNCKPDTLRSRLRLWGLVDLKNQGRRGRPRSNTRVPATDHFSKLSTLSSSKMKAKLFRDGHKARRCEECGLSRWFNDREIPLELDHVNGDPNDNRLENLRILCANCHALTPTHAGRNSGKRVRNGRTDNGQDQG